MKTISLLVAASFAAALPAMAQTRIDRFVIAGGGGATTSALFQAHGTIGQPAVGVMTGGSFALESGFWTGLRPAPEAPLPQEFPILAPTNQWRYQQHLNLDGIGWHLPGYDDSNWPQGEGLLAFEDALELQSSIHTTLVDPRMPLPGLAAPRTYYFRTHFALPGTTGLSLVFSNRLDDGAVAYLNGVEIWRVGVAEGPVSYGTLANRLVGDAIADDVVIAPVSGIARVGDNVLAVEVHQAAAGSSDVVWGCAVIGLVGELFTPPMITMQPQSQSICAGGRAMFSVTAAGTPPLSYSWRFNGRDIPGATASSLALDATQQGDAGEYSVRVIGPAGEAISASAALSVEARLALTGPGNVVALEGLPVSISALALSGEPFIYHWLKDGRPIPNETNASLVLNAATTNDAGIYEAVARSACGTATNRTMLSVTTPPMITDQPDDVIVQEGGTATLHVAASGTPPLHYQWRLHGAPLAGATNASYTLAGAQRADAGRFTVQVRNDAGSVVSHRASLTVLLDARLTIERRGATALISWHGSNFVLQTAAEIPGLWLDLSPGVTPDGLNYSWSVPLAAAKKFYRLRCQETPFTYSINPAITPSRPTLPGLSGGAPRPVTVIAEATGKSTEFIANEVIFRPANAAELNAFLAQYNGRVLRDGTPFTIPDAPKTRLSSIPSSGWYLIQVDPSRSALDDLVLNASRVGGQGLVAFSSEAGARLTALVARESNLRLSLNVLMDANDVPEHPDYGGGNLDAETWWYLTEDDNPTTPEIEGVSTGVIQAWRYLKYMNKPPTRGSWVPPVIAIVDSGFALNQTTGYPDLNNIDYPNFFTRPEWQMDVVDADGTAGGHPEVAGWHGQGAFGVAAARPGNGFGTAGTGGPVADWPMLIRFGGDFYTMADAIRTAWYNGADVINISWSGTCGPRWLCDIPPDDIYTSMQREVDLAVVAQNAIIVASAGNNDGDISGSDLIPVRLARVIGVGAIDRQGSNVFNYGDGVDIWAPTGIYPSDPGIPPDPIYSTLDPISVMLDSDNVGADELNRFGGTSASAPFISGVVALMRALDPSLRAEQALRILQETSNNRSSNPDPKVRTGWVDAFRAVAAVRPNQNPIVQIRSPGEGAAISYRNASFWASVTDPEQGTALDGVTIHWFLDGTTPMCLGEGPGARWCDVPALPLGTHTVTVRATDPFGGSGSASITVNVVNRLPIATIAMPMNDASFCSDQSIVFRGSASDFEDGPVSGLSWSSDRDGLLGTGSEISHRLSVGTHQITLRATDRAGSSATSSITVRVTPPCGRPSAGILSPSDLAEFAPGTLITFTGEGSDPEDGTLTGASLEWRSDRDGFLGSGNSIRVPLSGPACGVRVHTITLTVTDSAGNRTTVQIRVRIGRVC